MLYGAMSAPLFKVIGIQEDALWVKEKTER
jgi:hypothetical protein